MQLPGVDGGQIMQSDLLKVLRGEPAESVPLMLTGAGRAAVHAGTSISGMRESAEDMAEAQMTFAEASGMDWIVIYSDALYLPEAMGCNVSAGEKGPEIKEALGYADVKMPGEVDFYKTKSSRVVLDAIEYAVNKAPDTPIGVLFEGPFTTAVRMFGTENILIDLIDDKDKVTGVIKTITQVLCAFAEEAKKKGVSIIYIADPMSASNMISPAFYEEYSQPYEKALFGRVRELGLLSVLHICGNTREIWPGMADTGANALSLDQVVDFREVREILGPSIVIGGNVDPVGALLNGDPEKVAGEARASYERGGPGRFILMPGCGVPPKAPLENLKAMASFLKELNES